MKTVADFELQDKLKEEQRSIEKQYNDLLFSFESTKASLCEGCRMKLREEIHDIEIDGEKKRQIHHLLNDTKILCKANDWRTLHFRYPASDNITRGFPDVKPN